MVGWDLVCASKYARGIDAECNKNNRMRGIDLDLGQNVVKLQNIVVKLHNIVLKWIKRAWQNKNRPLSRGGIGSDHSW